MKKGPVNQAKTSIEVDGIQVTPEQDALVRARLLNEITEEDLIKGNGAR